MLITGITAYVLTLLVYVPGLVYAARTRKFYEFPVLSFCFLGMFVFNALGSILIAFPTLFDRSDYFSWTFVALLNVQALLFYALTGLYGLLIARRARPTPAPARPVSDLVFLHAVLAIVGVILFLYVNDAGIPPLIELLRGNLDENNIVGYRTQMTVELDRYYLYNLAFGPLPVILSVQALTLHLAHRLPAVYTYALILLSMLFASLPGGKGSVLDTFLALALTYVLVSWGYLATGRRPVGFRRLAIPLSFAIVPVVAMYKIYLGAEATVGTIFSSLVYRILGVYSETMAATVTYGDLRGFLEGATFPTIRGLLKHDQVGLSEEMHWFLFRIPGGAPVPATAEGYINFGWPGFLVMAAIVFLVAIALEEFFRRVRMDVFWLSILVFCVLIGSKVSQTSLFATLVSLTYTTAIAVLLVIRKVLTIVSLPSRTPLGHGLGPVDTGVVEASHPAPAGGTAPWP